MHGEKKGQKRTPAFKAIKVPENGYAFIPADLHILIPIARKISPVDRHYLAYLPWEKKYLSLIPQQYQEFFRYVLPSLHARTSNVHTALSVAQLPWLLKGKRETLDERLVYLALILHDCGWSQVKQDAIVSSFRYNGVTPSGPDSIKPKQQHLIYGEALAYKLLDSFTFKDNPLSSDAIYAIAEIIRRHDHDAKWEQNKYARVPAEVNIVCDADRLWSYTYENFWLDTVRKGVPPEAYLKNITEEIDAYFFTPAGKARAHQLILERCVEVQAYAALMNDEDVRAALVQKAAIRPKKVVYRARQLAHAAQSRRRQRALIRENAY